MSTFTIRLIYGILCAIIVIFIGNGIIYRMMHKNDKFKESLISRIGIVASVTVVYAIMSAISIGLIYLGHWMIDTGFASSWSNSSILFLVYLCVMGFGFILIIISGLMTLLYTVIELYAIWYYFVKPQIKVIKDEEVEKEGENYEDGWKEI